MNIEFLDGRKEVEEGFKIHVEADMIEFAECLLRSISATMIEK